MVRVQKNTLLILIGIVVGLLCSTPGQATTGNFAIVSTTNLDYYPETVLSIELTNLTINTSYAILIGANQAVQDQQWDNFTASATSMTRHIIHFDHQSYLDVNNNDIQYLAVILYDTSNTQLDTINYYVVSVKSQLDPYLLGMLLFVIIGTLVLFNILFTILKQFF